MLQSSVFWLSFVICAVISYGMYVIAWLFESRSPGDKPGVKVPVWRYQSKAFMPGDFGLSLLVATGVWLHAQVTIGWATSIWFGLVSLLAGLAIFIIARRFMYTPRDYTKEAWNSPSKRYHDGVMFFGFAGTAMYVCLPAYFVTDWSDNLLVKLLGLSGL